MHSGHSCRPFTVNRLERFRCVQSRTLTRFGSLTDKVKALRGGWRSVGFEEEHLRHLRHFSRCHCCDMTAAVILSHFISLLFSKIQCYVMFS